MALLLTRIVGFDSVDDESIYEPFYQNLNQTKPKQWVCEENPPYSYWCYYIYSNLQVLNKLRLSKNLNTFTFRPHSGATGPVDHLAVSYLTSYGISHGIMLRKCPVLQYLYYLKQIGLALSPISNSRLFVKYNKNPFPEFFRKGLNVTLSTDNPLMFHRTREPLLEEYSVAAQVFELN